MRKEIYHQYANSPKMVQFIESSANMISVINDMRNFYQYVFNINSAAGFGLDVWGDILNIPRSLLLEIEGVDTQYTMNDEEYRIVLKLAASKYISDAACENIYDALSLIFESYGNIYVTDLEGMHIRYSFEFLIPEILYAILKKTGVVPKPAGVDVEIYEMPSRKIFGFNGQNLEGFNNGTFFQGVK